MLQVLIAVLLLPMGFVADELTVGAVPWFLPTLVVLTAFAFILLWIACAILNVIKSKHAPWALSNETLWLECADQRAGRTLPSGDALRDLHHLALKQCAPAPCTRTAPPPAPGPQSVEKPCSSVPASFRVRSKCCVDQTNNATKKAGCEGFARFLKQCDGMLAFVSPGYFERLWCVCKMAASNPEPW